MQVGSTGLGDGLGVTGDCRVSPGSCPELLGRWRSLEGECEGGGWTSKHEEVGLELVKNLKCL